MRAQRASKIRSSAASIVRPPGLLSVQTMRLGYGRLLTGKTLLVVGTSPPDIDRMCWICAERPIANDGPREPGRARREGKRGRGGAAWAGGCAPGRASGRRERR